MSQREQVKLSPDEQARMQRELQRKKFELLSIQQTSGFAETDVSKSSQNGSQYNQAIHVRAYDTTGDEEHESLNYTRTDEMNLRESGRFSEVPMDHA